ncbi:Anti-sigma-K factor RskA [Oceanospirillum multiglobuliferum]|uniref:Anti-sigma factor n=1 Tax=Oceanospirillum multiglobuliferum TaxID=64969 RepID=A0A1T4R946_9GAMM|nr:hypothetical protein [Oceanospirillum multiglobuliferum]OPX55128.1 hypothetical protein BTE48_10195 [Oceanospirillum multiglobuliferum]SKA12542.1 Anti-sigma-K factor RskA [Oceanospirillum multiglobuliferum]
MHHPIDLTDPEQRNQAAGEYVLGTLSVQDKAAFEALLVFSTDLQKEVEQWREHLQLLNSQLEPVQPPKRVWRAIEEIVKPEPWFKRLNFWQWSTAVSFSCAFVLGLTLLLQKPPMDNTADHLYVVHNDEKKPAWLVNTSMDRSNVMVQTIDPAKLPSGLVCKLWLKINGEYLMLGTLPHNGLEKMMVPEPYRPMLVKAEVLVSVEPINGDNDPDKMGRVVDRGGFMPLSGSTRRF